MSKDALGYQVIVRASDSRVLATDAVAFRGIARSIITQGAPRGLIAFRLADDHLHSAVTCERLEAGRFARYAQIAIRARLGIPVPFEPARILPITTQHHMTRVVPYIFRQGQHHGVDLDPAHDASLLPDLLGLRILDPAARDRLERALPRVNRAQLIEWLGVRIERRLPPCYPLLPDAAAAAVGLSDLTGSTPHVVLARAAAVVVATSDLTTTEIGLLLRVDRSWVRRLRHERVPAEAITATRGQLILRTMLASADRLAPPVSKQA